MTEGELILLMAAYVQIDAQRRQEPGLISHNCFNKVEMDCTDIVPVFPRNPSESSEGVNCGKQKYCAGLDFSHTAAILLSTSSLQQQTRLPLLQLICDTG